MPGLLQNLKQRLGHFLNLSTQKEGRGEHVSALIQALEQALAHVEPRFLDLGGSFQTLYEETRTFSAWVGETIDLASGESADTSLTGTAAYARACVDRLKALQADMLDSLSIFENVEKGLEELESLSAGAEKIVLLLKVIVLNIGIESNRAKESADMFQSFIGEVRELSGHVDQVVRSLHHDSENIRKDHRKTVDEIRHHVSRLTRLADRADQELKDSARQIEAMMAKTLQSLNANRESGQAMERHLGDIVMALQMHDIIRQRVDGVIRELYGAETLIREEEPSSGGTAGALALLGQAEQLEAIVADVDRTCRSVSMSFKGIEHHLAELYQDVGQRVRGNRDLTSDKSPFSLLASSLKALNTLMEESVALGRVVDRRIAEASDKVQALSGYVKSVESISLDLQRKALNAIIKAAHLGEMGRGIEVFAREVGTASRSSTRFAENVVASISGIREMVAALHRNSDNGAGDVLSGNLLAGSDNILKAWERFSDNAGKVAAQFEKIESIIGRAESELVFFEEFSGELDDYTAKIRDLAREIAGKALDFMPCERLESPAQNDIVPPAALGAAALVSAMPRDEAAGEEPEILSSHEEQPVPETSPESEDDRDDDNGLGDNVELF